jgi:putative two-component system response regulator
MTDPITESEILIVDDQEANVRLLDVMLRRAGYQHVWSTTESHKARLMFREFQPDLVLLDLHMPHLDGYGVLEQLRMLTPRDEYLPILVITGDVTPAARERALASGARDFVSKPFEWSEVMLRIRNMLETRHLYLEQRRLNSELEERVRVRTQELEDAQSEILERLALAATFRGDATGRQARRVGRNSAVLARALGLGEAESERYRWAAPLHDIGNVAVSDQVLLKPGKLTAEEFDSVKQHITVGARLLSGSRFPLLQLAEQIALTHHERWDGSGYMGLRAEEIPLPGRIVAVCDVFDALTQRRPHKEPWNVDRAVDELKRQRGKLFDPRVVDAFLDPHMEALVGDDGGSWSSERARQPLAS